MAVRRQALVDSRFSTAICAPVYTKHDGLSAQVRVGPAEGLKHESSAHCDELVSLPNTVLTHYIGSLRAAAVDQLNASLAIAVGLEQGGPDVD
jgi:mRNA interferase MazF